MGRAENLTNKLCNDLLCQCCSRLIVGLPQPSAKMKGRSYHLILGTRTKEHQPSAAALEKSAQAGCPLCVQLWDYYLHSCQKPQDSLETVGKFIDSGFYYTYGNIEFSNDVCTAQFQQPGCNEYGGNICLIRLTPIDRRSQAAKFEATDNTGSEESVRATTDWLGDCIERHHRCYKIDYEKRHRYFPTRVLEVGDFRNPKLRLFINNKSSPPQGVNDYATLSHCWGNFQMKRLLKSTLSSMVEGLVFDELPKTFQEAIELSRELGIYYLWIDSLCIIQDSTEDWEKESAQMQFVYRNAKCNISAAAAANSREGCFSTRNPIFAQACRVRITWEKWDGVGDPTGIYDLSLGSIYGIGHPLDDLPLNKRAWVLQEQYLSRRIIHCTRHQLMWQCLELSASEKYPSGIPSEMGGYKQPELGLNFYAKLLKGESDREGLKIWNRIVEDYSRRSLTKEQDKLIAISGLAKDIQPIVHKSYSQEDSTYLAGLWEQFLPEQLLWKVPALPKSISVPVRTEAYCAPSWSWASLHGHVKTRDTQITSRTEVSGYMIQILEASTTPVASNAMGQLSEGHIFLRGWLIPLRVRSKYLTVTFDEVPKPSATQRGLFCLPIIKLKRDFKDRTSKERTPIIEGLVLKFTGESKTYKRIGIFSCYRDNGYTSWKKLVRPNYPSNSKTPSDGKAPFAEAATDLNYVRGRSLSERYDFDCDDYEKDVWLYDRDDPAWVEEIIALV